MPPRDWRFRLEDIVDAIRKIERYIAGMDVASFAADERTRDAVIWNIALIGEAARLIPSDIERAYPDIPWARMRGMRNVVIHEYPGVDDGIVWETATRNLPPLIDALLTILEREGSSGEGS